MTATITLANQRTFLAERGISVLDAALTSHLVLEHGCRTGRCGGCKAQVTAGESAVLREEVSLQPDEAAAGWILTCAREAVSDLALDIEDLGALATIGTKTLPCRIASLERLAPDVMKVTLRLPPNACFNFLAGQYIDITGPGGVKRSYSIASDARQPGQIELHVRAVEGGAMSRYWFHDAKPNDLLRFRGPLGTFFLRDVAGLHLVLLATGTGIAPMLSMLSALPHLALAERPASVSLYWGGRQPQDLYLADVAQRAPGLRYVPVLSRGDASWAGERGHVQQAFLRFAPNLATCAVYACGSQAMTDSARATLVAAGLPAKRFHADAFVSSN
ncbi:FAD-binding oxidoreductase [Ideonella sp. BN130291]|uniref:FAD-binding oxidoreductase n=1 Tax=Ideonella sp. BN130291 TaxID=3112940 RepID=UPI002E2587D8|nr:FAD-binding oxidoreductase [Ideonella sp. BN130291]